MQIITAVQTQCDMPVEAFGKALAKTNIKALYQQKWAVMVKYTVLVWGGRQLNPTKVIADTSQTTLHFYAET